jgi:hypothetical protein
MAIGYVHASGWRCDLIHRMSLPLDCRGLARGIIYAYANNHMHMLIIGVKSFGARAMRSRVELRATPLGPICSLLEAAGLATRRNGREIESVSINAVYRAYQNIIFELWAVSEQLINKRRSHGRRGAALLRAHHAEHRQRWRSCLLSSSAERQCHDHLVTNQMIGRPAEG